MDFWNGVYSEDYFHFIPDTLANLHEYDWSEDGTFKLDLWSIKSKLFLLKSNFLFYALILLFFFLSFSFLFHTMLKDQFLSKKLLIQIDYFAKYQFFWTKINKLTHCDIWIFDPKLPQIKQQKIKNDQNIWYFSN